MKVLLATFPFGATGTQPLDLLRRTGWDIIPNPHGRRLKSGELRDGLRGIDAVIAGTEPYTRKELQDASQLKVIARVGIGLDNVDMAFCRERNIQVTYTPDAPSDAVAELTVANILNLARHILESDRSVREKAWNRLMGRLLRELTVGIVGVGRIGSRVIRLLAPFQPRIYAVDTDPAIQGQMLPNTTWVDADTVFGQSDIVSLHIPLKRENRNYIDRARLSRMREGAVLINTSRGPIVDETALEEALRTGRLGGAALDVFNEEPYEGPLTRWPNVILTAHIAASARASRFLMEMGAAEDCIRVMEGRPPLHPAPDDSDAR